MTRTQTTYRIYVIRGGNPRGGKPMEYSATDYPSVADARVSARRLGEYAEIRRVKVVTTATLIERVEHIAA